MTVQNVGGESRSRPACVPKRAWLVVSALFLGTATLTAAGAQPANRSDWNVSLGLASLVRPTFAGSDRYIVTPLPLVNVVWRDTIALNYEGLSIYRRGGNLRIGAALTFDGGRDEDGGDRVVSFSSGDDRLLGMGEIDPSIGLKAFASYRLWGIELGASGTKFVGAQNEGILASLSATRRFALSQRFSLSPRIGVTWADQNYMQTFFGVTAPQAARTGFGQFDAEAGLLDVSAGLSATYLLSAHWFVRADAAVRSFQADARNSPLSFSNNNGVFSLSAGYQF